jgi:hypothetical protein
MKGIQPESENLGKPEQKTEKRGATLTTAPGQGKPHF